MAYLGTERLKVLLEANFDVNGVPVRPIEPYTAGNLIDAHYELTLGDQAYRTNSESGKKDILEEKKDCTLDIAPGQMALLLTNETVSIPNDKLAFISIKATQKFKGLVNISGFHVDPGWSGKLIFSVYNAGPSTITLERGKPYFSIWFSELQGTGEYTGKNGGQDSIPAKYIEKLKGKLASPNVLLERTKELANAQKRNSWLLGIIFTLFIGIAARLYWSSEMFNTEKLKITKELDEIEQLDEIVLKMNSLQLELDALKNGNSIKEEPQMPQEQGVK